MTTMNHYGSSNQGRVRFRNEDFIIYRDPEDPELHAKKGALFVVADGVGGHGAGDVASSEAGRDIVESYYSSKAKPDRALKRAFAHANLHVFDIGIATNRLHMQTTLSAIAIVGGTIHICHVGDSRIYRVRPPSQIELLTQDHSEVAELVRMNILSPDKVRNHPRRSVITRSLGSQPVMQPMFKTDKTQPGDIFVMCTDGIWEPVPDKEIAMIALTYPPDQACEKLIEMGIERQSTDNLSVQIVRVLTVEEEVAQAAPNITGWWGGLRRLLKRKRTAEEVKGTTICN